MDKALKHEGEKKRVQRMLDDHNQKYRGHIVIRGRSCEVYSELEGCVNWDWVACDEETGEESAIEVKVITDAKIEEMMKESYKILNEVRGSLLGQMPGVFLLTIDVPDDFYFPFRGQPQNRQIFVDAISEAVEQSMQTIEVGETIDLTERVKAKLPFELPHTAFLDLHKLDDEGKFLLVEPQTGGTGCVSLNEAELAWFEGIVLHASYQLKQSNASETFLLLIEERFKPTDPNGIAKAFQEMSRASYSNIKHVYFMSGETVREISLPD